MGRIATNIRSVNDAQYYAEKRLPRLIRDYFRAGSGARMTATANVEAFQKISFRPRVAVRYPDRDISTTVLGHRISMPIMIAPTGGGRLAHPDGERGGVRAAGSVGTIQWITTFSGTSIEEITADATGPIFFQLYYPGSRDASVELIERAEKCGCAALVLTVDTAVPSRAETPAKGRVTIYRGGATGLRPAMEYVRMARIFAARPRWTTSFLLDRGAGLRAGMVQVNGKPAHLFRATEILTKETPVWEDIPWVRQHWRGPLIIKGILTAEDARRAVDLGVDAISVSNHAGNMLDGDPATISVLPEILAAVDGRIEVYLDGGIRRGSDAIKAVAIGAKAVLVGRPWLWGLAADGEAGVRAVLLALQGQVSDTLGGLGCPSVQDLDRSYVRFPQEWLDFPR